MKQKAIFRGDNSRDMWNEINNAKTIEDLKLTLYTIGVKLQEFEHRVEKWMEE